MRKRQKVLVEEKKERKKKKEMEVGELERKWRDEEDEEK